MAAHVFDVAAFRALFPEFADATKYPDAVLSGYFSIAGCYIENWDNCFLSGDCLQLALNLMTAHITKLMYAAGNTSGSGSIVGVLQSATIDKVSVTIATPPTTDGWQYWLASTPYGLQLWALLQAAGAGGFYVGGLPEREGFRKIGGTFG